MEQQEQVRLEPRITINSLAEYMAAQPTRRAAIVRGHKRPRQVVVAHYAQAERPILDFLAAGGGSPEYLRRAASLLREKALRSDKPWRTRMLQDAAAAVESFADSVVDLAVPGPVHKAMPGETPCLLLGGVKVSVRPELQYTVPSRGQVGLVKLYFSKTRPLTPEAARYITAAMYQWGARVAGLGPELAPQRCLVLDVFAGQAFAGSKAFTRRMAELEAACEEISLRWPGA